VRGLREIDAGSERVQCRHVARSWSAFGYGLAGLGMSDVSGFVQVEPSARVRART